MVQDFGLECVLVGLTNKYKTINIYYMSLSTSGTITSNQSLDISNFYEMSIFTNYTLVLPLPQILCSNDNITWVEYDLLKKNYMYLADLMANYIKIESDQDFVVFYNANFKNSRTL